jgi:hypothetical protein
MLAVLTYAHNAPAMALHCTMPGARKTEGAGWLIRNRLHKSLPHIAVGNYVDPGGRIIGELEELLPGSQHSTRDRAASGRRRNSCRTGASR